jgi:hypothetical protein
MSTMHPPTLRARGGSEAGSTVLAALAILAVTLIAVGTALNESSNRFRTSYQSSRWSEASQAAEGGAEIALMSAQKNSWVADGWSAAPGASGTAAVTKTVTLDSGGPGTGPISARMSVDKVNLSGTDWLRIRATGIANLSGGARPGNDPRDIMLRKLNLRKDRFTGAAVTTPQATRTVEILAEPVGKPPFVRTFKLDKKLNMGGSSKIDSFDSSDPTKSTNGYYDVSKRQSHGDIGINDTQGASDLKNNDVYGDVAYSGPAIQNTGNVHGAVTTPFNDPVTAVLAPIWTTYNPTPGSITGNATLTGGTQSSPARYKVSTLNVPGGKTVTLASHAAGQDSYIEVWITGDMTTAGGGQIVQQAGVHVTYHVEGNIAISGSSFNAPSARAADNVINAITPPAGTPRTVSVSGNGTFTGAINAPGSDVTVSGSGEIVGAMIGKTMLLSGSGDVHFDEALKKFMGSAPKTGYRVASWVEAVR